MSVTKAIELLDIWINFYSKGGGGRAHGPDQAALEKIRSELDIQANQKTSYLERLEEEFLKLKEKDIFDNGPFYHVATITGQKTPFEPEKRKQMAQTTLSKIQEDKT